MARYKLTAKKSKPRKAVDPLPWLAAAFLLMLPFIFSLSGYEKFRIPKDIYSSISILLMGGVFLALRRINWSIRWKSWDMIILAGLAYALLHVLWSSAPGDSLEALLYVGLFTGLFWIYRVAISSGFHQTLWLLVSAALAVQAVITVLQNFGAFPFMLEPGGGVVAGRLNPSGFIGDVNTGGFLFGLACLLLLFHLFAAEKTATRVVAGTLLVLNLTGLFFTRTLTSLVSLAVCLAVWFVFHHWWVFRTKGKTTRTLVVFWVLLATGFAGGAVLAWQSGLGERVELVLRQIRRGDWTYATAGRYPVYVITWEMIRDRPLMGHGLNSFGRDFFFYRAETDTGQAQNLIPQPGAFRKTHNEYLQVWEELGIAGLLLFLFLLISPVVLSLPRLLREPDPRQAYWVGLLSIGILFTAVSSLTFFPFHLSVTAAFILLLMADLRRYGNPPEDVRFVFDTGHQSPVPFWQRPAFRIAVAGGAVVVLAFPFVRYWRANNEIGVASFLVEQAVSSNFDLARKRTFANEALQRLNRAESAAPRYYEIYNLKGSAYMVLGRYPDAVASYLKAAEAIPSPEIYTNLAAAHIERNELPEAEEYLDLALRYNPEYGPALEARRFLASR